jgi:hypothetical protein
MRFNTKKIVLAATLAVSLVGSPAFALDNSVHGNGKTRDELEDEGYTCELRGVGYWVCTNGQSEWWCDRSSCREMRLESSGNRRPEINPNVYSDIQVRR